MSQGNSEPGENGTPSSDRQGLRAGFSPLDTLGARLDAIRQREKQDEAARNPKLKLETGAYGAAWRLSVELVAGLIVGGGFGWLLDYWLGTRPWLMILFFLLGAAAGFNGVIKVARQLNEAAQRDDGPDKG